MHARATSPVPRRRPRRIALVGLLGLPLLGGCAAIRDAPEPTVAAPPLPAPSRSAHPATCADWRTGSYLTNATSFSYRTKFAPGDSVSVPAATFADPGIESTQTSVLTLSVGNETYVLAFSDDQGDAAHLFIFRKLADRFCVVGAWESGVGGNGAEARLKATWLAPDGHRMLLLLRSTAFARSYAYDAKPGEQCPPSDVDDDDAPAAKQGHCYVPPGFSAYFELLLLDTATHRLTQPYITHEGESGFGWKDPGLGPDNGYDAYAGEPAFVAAPGHLSLTFDGAEYPWDDARSEFTGFDASHRVGE